MTSRKSSRKKTIRKVLTHTGVAVGSAAAAAYLMHRYDKNHHAYQINQAQRVHRDNEQLRNDIEGLLTGNGILREDIRRTETERVNTNFLNEQLKRQLREREQDVFHVGNQLAAAESKSVRLQTELHNLSNAPPRQNRRRRGGLAV